MKIFTSNSLMSKLTFAITFSLVTVGLSGNLKAQESLTIQDAIDRMLQNNLNIKQSSLNVSTAAVNLEQSKAALYPSLNGTIDNSLNYGRSLNAATNTLVTQNFYSGDGSLNAQVDVFVGFSKINQIRQNKILLEAGNSNLDKMKNDLILQVVTAYFQVVFNTDLLKASKEQLLVAQETQRREQTLLEAGNKTLADISQAKAQTATAELNVTNAQNQLTISYLTLSQLMEMRADDNSYVVVKPTIQDIAQAQKNYDANDVYNTSLSFFPDIKLAQLNRQAAEKAVLVAKGAYYPKVTFGGGLGSRYSYLMATKGVSFPNMHFSDQISNNFYQNVGFTVQIPIFNGLQVRSNVKRAKISYETSKVSEQLAKNNLNKVIAQAVADLRAADSRYKSNENTFNAQKDAFNVIEQRYNVGLVNSLDYNTSRTNRNKAEVDYIQSKYDLLFKSKVIDYYLGKQITF
ncbi:TolC family protein [Pedobacter cryoconitis]|uniref:Outer membrane protein n=1 Tax=Pedobacter cryoconitis TaxID=188932 RepID=A0A7X0J3U4_9SPHI|nr:TolC family protein [Pedobacter cryoconitis]MBB6500385.1 outer membrane protein [Pedobacter cryoconitis]